MRRYLAIGLVSLCCLPAVLAKPREGLIVFKDGFTQQGKIVEMLDIIIDPATGQSFRVSAGGLCMYLDDGVRRIFFSHTQLHDVIERKKEELNDRTGFLKSPSRGTTLSIPGSWKLEKMGDWRSDWTRSLKFDSGRGPIETEQKIIALTPYQMLIQTKKYQWDMHYLTRELDPEFVQKLITDYMADSKVHKALKPFERRLETAKFLHEVGWHDLAEKELTSIENMYFDQKEKIAPLRELATKARATLLVDELDKAQKCGQHEHARALLERYEKEGYAGLVADRHRLLAEEAKGKYAGLKEKVEEAAKALEEISGHVTDKKLWARVAKEMAAGLNEDTLGRVESFAQYAEQFRKDIKAKRKPSQSADEVMALAVTGWLQGNVAAVTDVKLARSLWEMRDGVNAYVKATSAAARQKAFDGISKGGGLTVDQVARMIQMLPPPLHPEKITTDVETREIGVMDSAGGSYLVQLPPEYHPYRSYPVLMLLHGVREAPDVMLKRFSDLAARNGYILAAPLLGKGAYGYTAREKNIAVETLRDLRQVFNVDPDRVFLFGWESGADMAYDVGLSHPDQFAGVIPMNGNPKFFPTAYWSNGQYVPFYVIEGERNGGNPKANRNIFKDWVSCRYPSIYVEYKGRASEWYQAEIETIFDWIGRKKRFHPTRQLGLHNPGGGRGEEFCTMRRGDNKYYWISADAISDRHINSAGGWVKGTSPATISSSITVGNELEAKFKDGIVEKKAKVWTSVQVRTKGLDGVTLWLTPALHDFTRPMVVRWNGSPVKGWTVPRFVEPSLAVLLEDFANNGDRQRLHYAKIDMRE